MSDVRHGLAAIHGHEPELTAECLCSVRIDGADRVQLNRLLAEHAMEAAAAQELAEARASAPRGLAGARSALAEASSRKDGAL